MAALRIFISHASSDSAVAQRLANDLRNAGTEVLVDAADLTAPEDFPARIGRALSDHDALILILSPASVGSQWAPEAMTAAIARANQGLMRPPLLAQSAPVTPDDIPGLWTTYQRVDLASDYNRALPQVLAALGVAASVAPSVPVQSPRAPAPAPRYQAPPTPYAPYTSGEPAAKARPFPLGFALLSTLWHEDPCLEAWG